MIFTTKAEYGVRMLIQLGRHGSGHPVSLKAIAEAENLPLAYCERIAALLKKAGLVASTRGAHGGYVLGAPAEEITMDQAVLALEGAIAPMDCFLDDSDGRVPVLHHGEDTGRARPNCFGRACSWASFARCRGPRWRSSSSSTRAPPVPRSP